MSFPEKIKQLQDYLKTRPDLRKKWVFPIECDASETKCHSNEQTYIEYLMDATDFILEVCKKFDDVLRVYAEDQNEHKQKLQQLLKEFPDLVLGNPADFSRKDTPFEKGYVKGFYTVADEIEKWKEKFEAFLKEAETK